MLSVTTLLVLLAFGFTVAHGIWGRPPIWIAVLLLTITHLIGVFVR